MPAGVLLCACTEASRKQLSMDFAAATEMGAAAAVAGPPSPAPEGEDSGSTAQQRLMGKQYRALLSGVPERNEVRGCPWQCCHSTVVTNWQHPLSSLCSNGAAGFLCHTLPCILMCQQCHWMCRHIQSVTRRVGLHASVHATSATSL